MKTTANDIRMLAAIARYYVLSASMIQRICFPTRRDRRYTRRRLSALVHNRFVQRSSVNVAVSDRHSGPAYTPTPRGCELLALHFNDDAWLETNCKTPRIDRLHHWLDISWTHYVFDNAARDTPALEVTEWINEWQPTLDRNGSPTGFTLHTQFSETPPLSCSPDAAMLLGVGEHKRVYYIEVDRATSGARRVAASKTRGYAELARTCWHRKHLAGTTFDDFNVLLITTSEKHRDRLQREIAKKAEHQPELWMFADRDELAEGNPFYDPVFVDVQGRPVSLLKAPAAEARPTSEGTPDAA